MTFVILLVELESAETFQRNHFVESTKRFKPSDVVSQTLQEEENDNDKTKIDNYLFLVYKRGLL